MILLRSALNIEPDRLVLQETDIANRIPGKKSADGSVGDGFAHDCPIWPHDEPCRLDNVPFRLVMGFEQCGGFRPIHTINHRKLDAVLSNLLLRMLPEIGRQCINVNAFFI